MNTERAEKIDSAKKGAVFAKVARDDLWKEYDEAGELTEEENTEFLRKIGAAERELTEYKNDIRSLYRDKGDE